MNVLNKKHVDQLTIVEYDATYAGAVAEMWNNSQDGWGGSNTIMTEDQVVKQEANSTNQNLYLALDGDKVVGYCSLGEYREDEGALYIPLLNVRGDYHGKKVGKRLVLTAVQRAIELKWPRLDLYTWPGNTKAVPLYKKCGFFWEDRDDATHLMNFMPTVLQTEAVQDFFDGESWYETNTRVIEVKPDGNKEKDYHYYQYSWENSKDQALKMEFERFGRGLRLIETDDYLISASVENLKLVFGDDYKVSYRLINKSGKPLSVSMKGIDDKNIQFNNFEQNEINVKKETTIEATFHVNEIVEEQSVWRTHPTITTELMINGKKVVYKVGVLPKFPANVSCKAPEKISFIGKRSVFYIDIENNFDEKAAFLIDLPESDLLRIEESHREVTLDAKTKASIPVSYTLSKHGFYSPLLLITAKRKDGSVISFQKKIGAAFKGIGSKFSGECDDYYHLYNGQYHVWLQKFNNWLIPGKEKTDSQKTFWMYPKLGKPYSEEFARIRPERTEAFVESGYIGLRATYQSKTFDTIKLHAVVKIYSEGLIEHHYEVENCGDMETLDEIWLNNPVFHNLNRAVLPYKNKWIEMKDSIGSFHTYWNGDHMSENWIFSRDGSEPRGLHWSQEDHIHFGSWFVYFEHNMGRIEAKQTVKTNPVILSIGAFQTWQDFREFAVQEQGNTPNLTDHYELQLNNGNPFVNDKDLNATVTDYKASYFNGSIELSLNDSSEPIAARHFSSSEKIAEAPFSIDLPDESPVHVINAHLKLDSLEVKRQALALQRSDAPLQLATVRVEGKEVFTANNGLIKIAASAVFFPTLFSLKYRDQEWLDSSFPTLKPKSWWNPWSGGITGIFPDLSPNSILKEKGNVEFVSLNDNLGNRWQGLNISTKLNSHEKYKGLEFHQHFLMLPDSPVLCMTTEIVQSTSSYFDRKKWYTGCFFNPASEIAKSWARFQSDTGEQQTIYGGKGEVEMASFRSLVLGSDEQQHVLQLITDESKVDVDSYINKEVIEAGSAETIQLQHGKRYFTTPVFFLFNNQSIPDQALRGLKTIRF
jgi:ribosomal protein S18 acetylase RimI-like enzyme